METFDDKAVDNFTPVFKFYKQKKTPPSLKHVLGYPSFDLNENLKKFIFYPKNVHGSLGLSTKKPWNVIHINTIPGLYVIPNIFTHDGVKQWSRRCLEHYGKEPNRTNLDHVLSNEEKGVIWQRSSQSFQRHDRDDASAFKSTPVWKLRWSTLGYHHNWDTKIYDTDTKLDFPVDLEELCSVLADAISFEAFKSQAAIVNYYHVGSTLCAHVDNSEHNLTAPVISLSFGLPAIFLIGGKTKATRPSAIYLPSGCAVIMSGPARLAYHAIARILPADGPIPTESDAIDMFLRHTRININVRQVF